MTAKKKSINEKIERRQNEIQNVKFCARKSWVFLSFIILWSIHSCWPGVSFYLVWPSNDWINEWNVEQWTHQRKCSSEVEAAAKIVHTHREKKKKAEEPDKNWIEQWKSSKDVIGPIWLLKIMYININIWLPLPSTTQHSTAQRNTTSQGVRAGAAAVAALSVGTMWCLRNQQKKADSVSGFGRLLFDKIDCIGNLYVAIWMFYNIHPVVDDTTLNGKVFRPHFIDSLCVCACVRYILIYILTILFIFFSMTMCTLCAVSPDSPSPLAVVGWLGLL